MDEIRFSLSDETLKALRPPAVPSPSDSILRILQMLSIAGAALWTLYTYVTFGERNNDLTLRLASLQELQASLTLKATDLALKKGAIELRRLEQNPISLTHEVTAVRLHQMPGGRFRYLVTYNYTITNVSDRPLNVDRVIVRGFYAQTDHCRVESSEVNDFASTTPFTWARVFKRAHIFNDWPPKEPIVDSGEEVPAVHGGGGTGAVLSSEVLRGGVDLLITAKPTDLIGFKVRMRIGAGQDLTDPRFLRTIRIIQSTEVNGPNHKT